MNIRFLENSEETAWDEYVNGHPDATLCHLSGWRRVIESTYGHKSYYLLADSGAAGNGYGISGILPLIYIKSVLFGNSLVSMPFLNYGGVLSENDEAGKELVDGARNVGKSIGVKNIQLRQIDAVSWLEPDGVTAPGDTQTDVSGTRKVRMLLRLPQTSTNLFDSFKSKLRSQIRKPQKEGLAHVIGGIDLLADFYRVFSINMRDLGSPVHSRKLFENIMKEFGQKVKIGVIKHNGIPAAAGLVFCFRDTVEIIWASALREYNHLSPNMLLYWSLLEYVTDAGYRYFDFGRSTPNEGTYRFKEQWGAKPVWLHWYEVNTEGIAVDMKNVDRESQLRQKGEKIWQKIPISFANLLGPAIRRQIPL